MLTRDKLSTAAPEDVFGRLGEGRYLTEEERRASLQLMLASRPEGEGIWVFAYGSLIWNPTLNFAESQRGTLKHWRRAFCMKLTAGRATGDNPGRMLALVPGDGTEGIAYRLADASLEDELMVLWKREMSTTSYVPRWEAVELANGEQVRALVFVMSQDDITFDCHYESDNVARCIARAEGPLGTNADYLARLSAALHDNRIADPYIRQLAARVQECITGQALPDSVENDPPAACSGQAVC
ncbi:gamma-glutamylcyclotransferase [Pantoea piersonii]|uniref:gamma-glutamylcyclotransferase n=1 Tax=Pantoea piersonii TaxID=2364647 RepID=UPI00289D99A1|nr:gamma-glutamylcyclotransferase [Pantoea piersonii]